MVPSIWSKRKREIYYVIGVYKQILHGSNEYSNNVYINNISIIFMDEIIIHGNMGLCYRNDNNKYMNNNHTDMIVSTGTLALQIPPSP